MIANQSVECEIQAVEESIGKIHISTTETEDSNKRIIYTKEFLFILKSRENSKRIPYDLLPKLNDDDTFWDPEKYFTSLEAPKLSSANPEVKIQRPFKFEKKVPCTSSSNSLQIGDIHEIYFCSLNTSNNFHVNLTHMKNSIQQMYATINAFGNQSYKKNDVDFDAKLLDEPVLLALSENFWYRVKIVKSVQKPDENKTNPIKAFCIDNAKEFEPEGYLACPEQFKDIPEFGLNIALHGVNSSNFDLKVLLDFVAKSDSFYMKIVYPIVNKLYVELYNDKGVTLNSILNPKLVLQKKNVKI